VQNAGEQVREFQRRIQDAGGSVVEAIHGHKCGPDCWHRVKFDPSPKRGGPRTKPTGSPLGNLVKFAASGIRKLI